MEVAAFCLHVLLSSYAESVFVLIPLIAVVWQVSGSLPAALASFTLF